MTIPDHATPRNHDLLYTPYPKIQRRGHLLYAEYMWIISILTQYPEVVDKQLLWELIKMELRAKTIKYAKQKRSSLRNKEEALQNEL